VVVVIPAFVAVHVLGGILAGREFPGRSEEPGWLDTSFVITTVATVVAVALALLQYLLVRRARAGRSGDLQVYAAACVSPVALAAVLVVVVLMVGKPCRTRAAVVEDGNVAMPVHLTKSLPIACLSSTCRE
jgi:cytochrome bd-type quinol oxidase subunit 2